MMQLVKIGARQRRKMGGEPMGQTGPENADVPAREAPLSPQSVHLIRTAQAGTLNLSQMADGKANILIGATFVVFSLVITSAFSEAVKWSIICLAVTSFLSAICAVLAITPPMRAKVVPQDHVNLLFFGHFSLMDEEAWVSEMLGRLRSDEALYRVMLRDLYQNGLVLHRRKYRLLAMAYHIFLGGLGLTLVVFLLENLF
jgi:hypothetical protein